jgi:glyoxylase-like metal-dependent hydrolase (beta-lactamase superfamily II)
LAKGEEFPDQEAGVSSPQAAPKPTKKIRRVRRASVSDNFEIQPVAEGIYAAIARMNGPALGSNAAIIVDYDSVLIVDTHMRPSAAREVLENVKRITPLPVRYVVNSHFHNDHTQGNQAYFNAFPRGVEYVCHSNTRRDIIRKAIPRVREQLKTLPVQIRETERQLAGATDAQERARLHKEIDGNRAYFEELRQIDITLPTLTFDNSLFFHRAHDIRVHYFGRGHTAGDIVLLLPKQRVLISGDLFLGPHIPYAVDSYPSHWAKTLRATAKLDFDQVILGHTSNVRGDQARKEMETLINFMEDVVAQVTEMVRDRKSLETVKAGLNLKKYKGEFANWETHSGIFIERAYVEAVGNIED